MQGVYASKQKNGQLSYRASFTYQNRHISLGSYKYEKQASNAYKYAVALMGSSLSINDYPEDCPLMFDKFVVLCNLRDNGIYIVNPIYLDKRFFTYHLSPMENLKFDMDDLFFFSSHKLMKRGKHLFVSNYGLQESLNERYGIRAFSVPGKDHIFRNGDENDYRRENIEIINPYFGVSREIKKTTVLYKTVIHVNGNIIVGRYETEEEAAVAYNKAADFLKSKGINKNFPQNYVSKLKAREYAEMYTNVKLSPRLATLVNNQ